MPSWYCLMVRKGSEASVAERVVQALGLGDADVVLSKVNQWFLLVRMEPTPSNIVSVAQIPEAMFFVGSPNPPEVPETDVDVVREGREGHGEDSFLARHFGEWMWKRMREETDEASGVLRGAMEAARFRLQHPKETLQSQQIDGAAFASIVGVVLSVAWLAYLSHVLEAMFVGFGGELPLKTRMVFSRWWPLGWLTLFSGLTGVSFWERLRPKGWWFGFAVAILLAAFVILTIWGFYLPIACSFTGVIK